MIGPPIFVVGCGHSGTTLVRRLVGQQKGLYEVPFETQMFVNPRDPLFDHGLVERVKQRISVTDSSHRGYVLATPTRYVRQIADFSDHEAMLKGATRWIEKTPRHVRYMGDLLSELPAARVVVVRRDGRDVVASILRKLGPGSCEAAVRRWVEDNDAADKWQGHRRVCYLRLEDLIGHPNDELKRLLEWLGVEQSMRAESGLPDAERRRWRSGPLTERRRWLSYRRWLAAQPIFDTSGQWRRELSRAEQELVDAIAGVRLQEYGYGRCIV